MSAPTLRSIRSVRRSHRSPRSERRLSEPKDPSRRISRFVATLLTALSAALAFGHLMEMPARLAWDAPLWIQTTVTGNLFRAFGTFGAAIEVGAVLATASLAFRLRGTGRTFRYALVGALLMSAAHALFWPLVRPVNLEMAGWTPEGFPWIGRHGAPSGSTHMAPVPYSRSARWRHCWSRLSHSSHPRAGHRARAPGVRTDSASPRPSARPAPQPRSPPTRVCALQFVVGFVARALAG